MVCYKIVLSINQKTEQLEIESIAGSIRTTLKDSTEFSVFSTTTKDNITIYFSSLAFELCTVLSEKFGFESFDCSVKEFNTLNSLTV